MATAKILDIKKGDKELIWVTAEYLVDGVTTTHALPVDFRNIIGKTSEEAVAWIDREVNVFIDHLIEKAFRVKVNDSLAKVDLSSLVGREYSKESADVFTDKSKVMTIKPDGTYVEKLTAVEK